MQAMNGFLFLAFAALLTLTGCQSGESSFAYSVEGSVTLDGAVVEKGSIEFFPFEGNGKNTGTKIVNGKYNCDIEAGEYRVKIRAPIVVGKAPLYEEGGPERELTEESIPIQYNDESTLKIKIDSEDLKKDFELIKS